MAIALDSVKFGQKLDTLCVSRMGKIRVKCIDFVLHYMLTNL